MVRVCVGGVVRDVDAIVLDKDGTLVDFEAAWLGRFTRSMRAVAQAAQGDDLLIAALHRTLGSAGENEAVLPDGPFVSSNLAEKAVMVATVLYQSGIAWNRARSVVASTFLPIFGAPPETDEIRAIGNVVERLRGFKAGGLQIAVATNDERSATLTALQGLGVIEFVDEIVCGDDAGLAGKPSADGLMHIARILGIPPKRLLMVGDSVSDMMAGKAAGVSLTVGVLSGPSKSEQLAAHADVIVPDIHSLEVH